MKLSSIVYLLPLALLTACGGESANSDKGVSISTQSSISSSSSAINNNKIIEVVSPLQNEYEIIKANLDINKQKWALRNIKSYQYNYKVSCFCLDEVTQNKQVTVYDGAVTEAFFIKTSEYITKEQLSNIKTVDKLFKVIDDAIKNKAYRIIVSYNQNYGYPEQISIDKVENIADDEITYYASDLM